MVEVVFLGTPTLPAHYSYQTVRINCSSRHIMMHRIVFVVLCASLAAARRPTVEELLPQLSTWQKIGQMTQLNIDQILTNNQVARMISCVALARLTFAFLPG